MKTVAIVRAKGVGPDLAALARTCGAQARRLGSPKNFCRLSSARDCGRAAVLHFLTNPDLITTRMTLTAPGAKLPKPTGTAP